jgi:kynurenine formamidase
LLNPRRFPPVLRPTLFGGRPIFNHLRSHEHPSFDDIVCDDLALLHLQYSTQWDSLAHVGMMFDTDGDGVPEPVYYNGYRAGEHIVGPSAASDAGAAGSMAPHSTSEARALGIENLAAKGMQGRGVLIDLAAHLGRARQLVGYEALMRIIESDKIEIEPGDMVCLRTGFDETVLGMARQPTKEALQNACAVLDGRDRRLLQWVSDSALAALIADNYAVEAVPARQVEGHGASLPLHEHCLFKLGVNLGELWHLSPLADWLRAQDRSRFLLTAPPLRLPGAVGSPVTPIATV